MAGHRPPDAEREAIEQIVEKGSGRSCGGPGTDPDGSHPGNHIDGTELAQLGSFAGRDVNGIDLEEIAGMLGLIGGGLAGGMAPVGTGPAQADGAGFPQASGGLQASQDAAHGGFREGAALLTQQGQQLALPPYPAPRQHTAKDS